MITTAKCGSWNITTTKVGIDTTHLVFIREKTPITNEDAGNATIGNPSVFNYPMSQDKESTTASMEVLHAIRRSLQDRNVQLPMIETREGEMICSAVMNGIPIPPSLDYSFGPATIPKSGTLCGYVVLKKTGMPEKI